MNRTLTWLSAALILGSLPAQDPDTSSGVEARLKELEGERGQIIKQWREDMTKASEAREKGEKIVKAIAMRPDFSPLRAKYLAGADEHAAAAVLFLMPALDFSSSADEYREILDRLVNKHLGDENIWMVGAFLPRLDRMVSPEYKSELVTKLKNCDNPRLKTWVTWIEAEETLRAYGKAKAKVLAALDEANDDRVRRMFDQITIETEKFGIGAEAPDIVGVDLDGVAFKLSDYKGKVVFLDFWGDW